MIEMFHPGVRNQDFRFTFKKTIYIGEIGIVVKYISPQNQIQVFRARLFTNQKDIKEILAKVLKTIDPSKST